VAPYLLKGLNKYTTTGVCAHTSDYDVARLEWLLKLPLHGKRIGVLRNSNRSDTAKQKQDIDDAMTAHKCTPRHRDINGADTIKDIFDLFHGDIHGLMVAADSFFYNDRQEVVDRANANKFPTIYQWCEFVDLGGLMSYGPKISQCYDQAAIIAAQIINGAINPPYLVWEPKYPNDFQLCVSEARARGLNMWPLPASITSYPQYAQKP
jgi:putative tryptophan/tyrosine transport system substrate-binding protein